MKTKQDLKASDKQFIWHPFTQMQDWERSAPIIISEGKGCFLRDLDGKWYLDGVSSLWVNVHGHRKKEIDRAIKAQVNKISHSTLLGLSNEPAILLAERLVKLLNAPLPAPHYARVFYSDNGSTAVEVALKMAFQYWRHTGVETKNSFLCLNNAYHGDTLGAVSVGGIDMFHKAFGPLLFRTFRAPSPFCYRCELQRHHPECGCACLGPMEEILKSHHQEIAGLIIEPLVQAAGGMIMSPPGYLKGVRELCTKYDVLMIADEVATGFGRTGRMFACEHEDVLPDIVCLSKGLTGGYLPLAATMTTDRIYSAFLGEFRDLKTFFHGHSFTGNPLGCAAALACLEIFEKERVVERLQPKVLLLKKLLGEMNGLAHVGDTRSRGLMAAVELVLDKGTREPYSWEDRIGWKVALKAREKGLLIRPLGNIIVIMPPLSITKKDLARLMSVIKESIEEVT
ncbi:MAG: adenosylmethionine--8-amino-7-oxononanoate transaminase [Nitrospirae bacterium]|nr:MAG: adenosylmethionine--8-amino-7-oxononanoate transaminase [Nitrospirota bacterium]